MLSRFNISSFLPLIMYGIAHIGRIHSFRSTVIPRRFLSTPLYQQRTFRPGSNLDSRVDETVATANDRPSEHHQQQKLLNLSTVTLDDLTSIITTGWGFPAFRAQQVFHWLRVQGVTDIDRMSNLPASLREKLSTYSRPSSLEIRANQVSPADGTIKRAYACSDGQVIESVLMPYADGRYTACISSQAGCSQGCVFCATGQMGYARQLTSDEMFEQVARFAAELQHPPDGGPPQRLSNIVFMGMGEPLANYRNVRTAIQRITKELKIGARKITVSTVGVVPGILKLAKDKEMPQVRLALSLHSADDKERSQLIPANRRNGGLTKLMSALRSYIEITRNRVTLEWALIAGENDTVESARQLGELITSVEHKLRRDLIHVNVIPLNKTGQYKGRPSQKKAVDQFCATLQDEFNVACTPRVRRGIDIDAGCGQLTAKIMKEQQQQRLARGTEKHQSPNSEQPAATTPSNTNAERPTATTISGSKSPSKHIRLNVAKKRAPTIMENPIIAQDVVDMDADADYVDVEFKGSQLSEAKKILAQYAGKTIDIDTFQSKKDSGATP